MERARLKLEVRDWFKILQISNDLEINELEYNLFIDKGIEVEQRCIDLFSSNEFKHFDGFISIMKMQNDFTFNLFNKYDSKSGSYTKPIFVHRKELIDMNQKHYIQPLIYSRLWQK